jgi:hypothetical protein
MKPHTHDNMKHLINVLEHAHLYKAAPEGSEQQIAHTLKKETITKILTIIKKIEEFDPCL